MVDSPDTLFSPYMIKKGSSESDRDINLKGRLIRILLVISSRKIEPESPEFWKIVTKAAVIDANLDRGIYLLGNRSANLLEVQRKTPNLNAVVTRGQK
ncbi:hypothetical protein AVEN_118108-1 [Araneus ventricosus]|uniref:Uncharacterized protein n=1 Tax=Araneus ventricosus TaxID=182803 RepID=A0A4Y2BFS5_ARAVE|nr:hypothetical protein AVEN_118108-1 [Araneus ventricosus]